MFLPVLESPLAADITTDQHNMYCSRLRFLYKRFQLWSFKWKRNCRLLGNRQLIAGCLSCIITAEGWKANNCKIENTKRNPWVLDEQGT